MTEPSTTLAEIPHYLSTYIVDQDYDSYTAQDHATWRFVMRNARDHLKEHAHGVYLEGLNQTGIPIDRIPKVSTMDQVLRKFGWGAVCVRGFIPPLAFLDFQARKVLPIAADMRTIDHILYTPAPDILHEAAGHAPIIADPEYANYLTLYASMARKAIFSQEDIRVYEAIRLLSDTKENPDSSPEDIEAAELALQKAADQVSWDSEASRVSRMFWWTAEYGLVGDIAQPQIYGAGLLSSIGEGRDCLSDKVKKIPLSIACTEQTYDITRPQPQLFVARDFKHLTEVLLELDADLSYQRGGLFGVRTGHRSQAVTTTVFESGLSITGVLTSFEENGADQCCPEFMKWSGPVQLADNGIEITGQGRTRHPEGFSAALGRWKKAADRCPSKLSDSELAEMGIIKGATASIEFLSGMTLTGRLEQLIRSESGRLLVLTWTDCTIKSSTSSYYLPEWGPCDLPVGDNVTSVYGGPADWETYGAYDIGTSSSLPGRTTPYTTEERRVFEIFEQLRILRKTDLIDEKLVESQLVDLVAEINRDFPRQWLLGIEIAEICAQKLKCSIDDKPWSQALRQGVLNLESMQPSLHRFVEMGLALAAVPD